MTPADQLAAAVVRAIAEDPGSLETLAAAIAPHMATSSGPFLNSAEAASLLRIPEKTVRQYARDGVLPALPKVGRNWVFERAEVERALREGRLAA